MPLRAEHRVLVAGQPGDPIARSPLESAWQHFITTALREGVVEKQHRFSLHGLKHLGVTGIVGNCGNKQDAAGHQLPTTTGR